MIKKIKEIISGDVPVVQFTSAEFWTVLLGCALTPFAAWLIVYRITEDRNRPPPEPTVTIQKVIHEVECGPGKPFIFNGKQLKEADVYDF